MRIVGIVQSLAIAIALLGTIALSRPAAAQNPLALAPADSEVVLHLKAAALAGSPAFQAFLQEPEGQKLVNQVKFVQMLTDVDPFKDISDLWVFGRIDEDDSNVIVARGRFNQQKLVDLVKLNESYRTATILDTPVHAWNDKGTEKFGTFLAADLLVIAGGEPAMTALLTARKDPAQSFLSTPVGKSLADDLDSHHFWGMLIRTPGIDCDFGDMARKIDLSHALLTLDAGAADVQARLYLKPDRQEVLPSYKDAAEGGLAVARLLSEEDKNARLVAEHVKVEATLTDPSVLMIIGSMTNEELLALMRERF